MLRTTAIAALLATAVHSAFGAGAGDLDLGFAGDGQITTAFTTDGYLTRVLAQSDGKTLVVGNAYNGIFATHALLRHLDAGPLDPTFGGGDGIVLPAFFPTNILPFMYGAVLQEDGKIVTVSEGGSVGARMVVRYESDGDLDPTFGSSGVVILDVGEHTNDALAVQDDGKIVIATRETISAVSFGIALVRLLSNGDPDPMFGTAGVALIATPIDNSGAAHVVVQPDGKIVVASTAGGGPLLLRVHDDGTPDAGFGTGGVAVVDPLVFLGRTDCIASVGGMVRRPDGRFVTAGEVRCFLDPVIAGTALTQHLADGSLDSTFGNGGVVAPAITEPGASDAVLDADGRLIVGRTDLGAARYDAQGFLDPTFGVGGATIDDTPEPSLGASIALRPDGHIVIGGVTFRSGAELLQHLTVTRRLTACPALPDTDGDGIGDSCDRCTDGSTLERGRLVVTNLTTPIGDDGYQVKGQFVVTDPGSVDLQATGVRISFQDALGRALVEVVVPPGGYDAVTQAGWTTRVSGGSTVFRYLNKGTTVPLVDGVTNASAKVSADGTVSLKLKAKRSEMPIDPARLPVDMALILDPPRAETGLCGEITFDGVSGSCVFSASGRKLACR